MIAAHAITVSINRRDLIKKISIGIKPGTIVVVVGPNGAGKTTLLRALSGEITATQGSVLFDGIPITQWDRQQRARRCAVLPQQSTLQFTFRVIDVVLMGRSPHKTDDNVNINIARAALHAMDAELLENRIYTTLSGGERQRVQTARVLAQIWEPLENQDRYLLLDEPIAALDLGHQYSLLSLIFKMVRSANIGVLTTLHDLNLAAHYADAIVVLDNGSVVAEGDPRSVFDAELIQDIFGVPVIISQHPRNQDIPLIIPNPEQ